tara:strand:- start:5109 stop:6518 length:1410 start_codon:yes stop_codon:yes gene_type:complete
MNKITEYMKTKNNALCYSDVNKCLDLFSKIGGLRNASRNRVVEMFEEAFNENPELATRISYWARAAREGSGERNTFYLILDEIAKCSPAFVSDNARTLAELGYYKDLIRYFHIPGVVSAFAQSIREKDRLACKWSPRKGENAKLLRDELGFTNRDYRKWLKRYSTTVEQQMSNREWDDVNYSSVPGGAMRRYGKAFETRDGKRFDEWKNDKTTKASVSASYPHEVMAVAVKDEQLAQKLWDNLPDLIKEGENILPMIDTSGSMYGLPIEVAISLGLYLSINNKGKFNSKYLTFSENPKLGHIPQGTLLEIRQKIMGDGWGMNTDFEKAYHLILDLAEKFDVKDEDMPTMLLVLSDMQFDDSHNRGEKPHLDNIRRLFEERGYTMPKLVFWNLEGSHYGSPSMPSVDGVGMVSGFSPSIMKAVLDCDDFTPLGIMERALESIILNYDNLPKKLDIVKDEHEPEMTEYGWR